MLLALAMVTGIFLIVYTLALTLIPIIDVYSEKHCTWLNQNVSSLKHLNDAYYAPHWLVILYIIGPFLGSENPSFLLLIHVNLFFIFIFIQTHIMPFGEPDKQRYLRKDMCFTL